MAFVALKQGFNDIFYPEHTILWIEVLRSPDTSKRNHQTVICLKTEDGSRIEETFDGEPNFVSYGR